MSVQRTLSAEIIELVRKIYEEEKGGEDAAKTPERHLIVLLETIHRNLTDIHSAATLSSTVDEAACIMCDEVYGTGEEESTVQQ